mmetsp:Transcript_18835/g.42157  ORF Transcript_18835/g.42157 Transcript_18835/m.42157 type:complete len:114 (+) Transcript_18835:191-532(+)
MAGLNKQPQNPRPRIKSSCQSEPCHNETGISVLSRMKGLNRELRNFINLFWIQRLIISSEPCFAAGLSSSCLFCPANTNPPCHWSTKRAACPGFSKFMKAYPRFVHDFKKAGM